MKLSTISWMQDIFLHGVQHAIALAELANTSWIWLNGDYSAILSAEFTPAFQEYLEDYATESTRNAGKACINNEVENCPKDRRSVVESRLQRIEQGKRDLYLSATDFAICSRRIVRHVIAIRPQHFSYMLQPPPYILGCGQS